jgi:voltage-gated potassium channel Kch
VRLAVTTRFITPGEKLDMNGSVTIYDRMRYAFDNSLSKGPIAIIGWLALATAVVILFVALVDWLAGFAPDEVSSVPSLLWMNLMRLLDAGTMGGDEGSVAFLGSMLAVTLCGIFVTSILIGTITSGIEAKLDELRKGRSQIIESDHTVILGWSEQIFSVISELVIANENQRRPAIAVLADRDKVEMEDEIRDKVGSTKNTRIVCRSGSPIDIGDLDIVSIKTSRSVIVLPPEGEEPDSSVIKTLLAIINSPNRREAPYHVVTEIRDPKNLEVARMVARDEGEFVLATDLVARLMAQTCRQSGLSVVYTELLDFDGDEIYFAEAPELAGKTFREALHAFEDSAAIGLVPKGGTPRLNPPMDTVIGPDDRVVVVTEDDDTAKVSGLAVHVDESAIVATAVVPPVPERTLLLGWNKRAPLIINELDHYVADGSQVFVVADHAAGEAEIARSCTDLKHQRVKYLVGDTTDRRTLDSLGVETFDHVILLCYDRVDAQRADAKTLVTLLHLRDIQERSGTRATIVSEMLDIRNRNLADVTRADYLILSDRLISLMISQISENKALNAVFADLFDPDGSEIYLKLASDYVRLGEPMSFYTVVEAARQRNEVALGYRLVRHAGDAAKAYGVVVNPTKSELVTFSEWDRLIVLAED